MTSRVWLPSDAQFLAQLREAAGMDAHELSRRCLLSLGQIQALEGQGNGKQFYSEAIKFTAGTKALAVLGAKPLTPHDPPTAEVLLAKPSAEDRSVAEPVGTVNGRAPHSTPRSVPRMKGRWVRALMLVLVLVGAVVFYAARNDSSSGAAPGPQQQPLASQAQPPTQAPAPEMAAPKSADKTEAQSAGAVDCTQALQADKAHAFTWPSASINPGNYVHFVAKRQATLCTEDAQGKVTQLVLNKDEAISVYGNPPFKVWHPDATIVQMYYQGWKVAGRAAQAGVTVFQP